MVKRIGSIKRKSRHKLSKKTRKKGKISTSTYFQTLKIGSRVVLKAESAIQKGMYAPRFYGKMGIVKSKKGSCYEILIKDQNKQKTLTVHPVHLKKIWGI